MNILQIFFTGNLTEDATVAEYSGKLVHNFTVAVNTYSGKPEPNVNYFDCSYWTKKPEGQSEEKTTLNSILKKGKSVTVLCNALKVTTSDNKEGTKSYQNLNFTVSQLNLN